MTSNNFTKLTKRPGPIKHALEGSDIEQPNFQGAKMKKKKDNLHGSKKEGVYHAEKAKRLSET